MTYILNVIVLGDQNPLDVQAGQLVAEVEVPFSARLTVGSFRIAGTRYLLVTDDADNYRGSMRLVSVPSQRERATCLKILEPFKADFASTMSGLFSRSPSAQMCVYLEATFIISVFGLQPPP